jgi:hypothetical protein
MMLIMMFVACINVCVAGVYMHVMHGSASTCRSVAVQIYVRSVYVCIALKGTWEQYNRSQQYSRQAGSTVSRGRLQQVVSSGTARRQVGRLARQIFFLFPKERGEKNRCVFKSLLVFFRKIRCRAYSTAPPYGPSHSVRSWGSAESGPWST